MARRASLLVAAALCVALGALAPGRVAAQGITSGRARLFVANNNASDPSVFVINLPSFNVTQKIQLPGTTLQLGLSGGRRYLGVFRARNNNEQYFTVVNTGVMPLDPVAGPKPERPAPLKAGEMGMMRPAAVVKALILRNGTDGIAGVEYGQDLVYHDGWGVHLLYLESHGMILAYQPSALSPTQAFTEAGRMRVPVGHFHVQPAGQHVLVPHTGAQAVFALNRKGVIVREYPCGGCHGSGKYQVDQTNYVSVFGCNTSVLVVRNLGEPVHLPTTSPRVGAFVQGAPGVFWSSNSAQQFFWRTDVRGAAPNLTSVPHRGGILRLMEIPARGAFVAVHNDGNMTMYHGITGAPLAHVVLREGGLPSSQAAPMLQVYNAGRSILVSYPSVGAIHLISARYPPAAARLEIAYTAVVGGTPSAMAVAELLAEPIPDEVDDDNHGHEHASPSPSPSSLTPAGSAPATAPTPAGATPVPAAVDDDHDHEDGEDHDHEDGEDHDHDHEGEGEPHGASPAPMPMPMPKLASDAEHEHDDHGVPSPKGADNHAPAPEHSHDGEEDDHDHGDGEDHSDHGHE